MLQIPKMQTVCHNSCFKRLLKTVLLTEQKCSEVEKLNTVEQFLIGVN